MTLPDISVVVLPFTGVGALQRCLEALETQAGVEHIQILVLHDQTLNAPGALASRFARVEMLPVPGQRTPAELRAHGVSAARADIVALIEDHCTPDKDWCARILHWHGDAHAAVGGAVEKGFPVGQESDTALNWAVYMSDYSRYMNPLRAAPTQSITDTNSSYKMSELRQIRDVWSREFHENIVNETLRSRGRTLWFAPDAIVREQRSLSVGDALSDRYSFGRLYASTRVTDVSVVRRAAMAAASVLMPPVLVLRVARTLFERRRHRAQFIRS